MLAMHSRLNALHALYNPTASVPQGIDNA
jgi:hypothetical protein